MGFAPKMFLFKQHLGPGKTMFGVLLGKGMAAQKISQITKPVAKKKQFNPIERFKHEKDGFASRPTPLPPPPVR